MRRPFPSILLVGALVLVAAVPVAAQAARDDEEEDREDDGNRGSDRADSERAERDQREAEREAERDSQRPAGSIGQFRMEPDGRVVHGSHVSFAFNDTGVQHFTADGVFLFNLTVLGGEDGDDRPSVDGEGSNLKVSTSTFEFKAHDNPVATAKLDTDGLAILTFPPDTRFEEKEHRHVLFRVGNVTGHLKGDEVHVENRTVRVEGEAIITLHQARGGYDQHRPDLSRAIVKGHVGAEGTFGKRPDSGDLVEEVVSYGNVTMSTLKAERGNLTVVVEGHGTEGRVLVLNVDARVVGAQKREDLSVLMDNMSIGPAANLNDVLNPDDDGYLPEYYVVFDPATESFQLLVSVPHYSVHVLSVVTAIPLPPPSVVLGIVAGVALLVPGAWVLFRRKDE